MKQPLTTWKTLIDHLDKETGEFIHKYQVDNGSYLIESILTTFKMTGKHYGTRKITKVCIRNRQGKLFGE